VIKPSPGAAIQATTIRSPAAKAIIPELLVSLLPNSGGMRIAM
jgi:hypothetical protein